MTILYLLLSTLAAVGFYLASIHQRLWSPAGAHRRTLHVAAWITTALATAAAIVALGPWAGVFAALTTIMLILVLLPYLDAWCRLQRGNRDVG